jgi:hypothetical protein
MTSILQPAGISVIKDEEDGRLLSAELSEFGAEHWSTAGTGDFFDRGISCAGKRIEQTTSPFSSSARLKLPPAP